MLIIWGLLPCLLLLTAVFIQSRKGSGRQGGKENACRREQFFEERTELYELLLYAQKKYRETGEESYLSDIQTVQARIAEHEKVLRQIVPED